MQGLLELAGVPYVGCGVLGSALAMDKAMAKEVLAANGIPQARYRGLPRARDHARAVRSGSPTSSGYPMFVKPANMGSSVGVTQGARRVEACATPSSSALSLRRVGRGRGGDRRPRDRGAPCSATSSPRAACPARSCPAPSSTTTPTSTSTTARSCSSRAAVPRGDRRGAALWPSQVFQAAAVRGHGPGRLLLRGRPGGRGFLCNEINTIPGFTPISMYPKMWIASGLSYSALIDELVQLAIERHGRRRRNTAH